MYAFGALMCMSKASSMRWLRDLCEIGCTVLQGCVLCRSKLLSRAKNKMPMLVASVGAWELLLVVRGAVLADQTAQLDA